MFIITSCITGFSGLQYAIFADGKVQPWNTYWKKTEGSDATTKEITNHTAWMVATVETPPLSVCLSVSMSCQSCKWVTHENTCWPLMCYIDVLSWIGPWYLNWAQIVQLGFQQFSYKNEINISHSDLTRILAKTRKSFLWFKVGEFWEAIKMHWRSEAI